MSKKSQAPKEPAVPNRHSSETSEPSNSPVDNKAKPKAEEKAENSLLPTLGQLAELASQPRYANLRPDQAASNAMSVWKEAQKVVEETRRFEQQQYEWYVKPLEGLALPEDFPVSFNEFLKSVVRGKDEAENLMRFRRFLAYEAAVADHMATPESWEAVNATFPEVPTTDERLGPRLAEYKVREWDRCNFESLALRFRRWWLWSKAEGKKRGGQNRQAKANKLSLDVAIDGFADPDRPDPTVLLTG